MPTGALTPITRWSIFNDGQPSPGAKLYTWLSGTSTPQSVYNNADLDPSHAHTNPVVADADGVFPVIYLAPVAYRVLITDANGATIFAAQDNVYDFSQLFEVELASSSGSSLIGFINTGSGAVATTVQTKLRETLSLQADFGAVGNNVTDDTTAVQNWLNAVATTGKTGYAEPGRYVISSALTVTLTNDNPFRIVGSLSGSNVSPYGSRFRLSADLANNNTPMLLINGNNQSSLVVLESLMFDGGSHTGSGVQLKNVNGRNEVRLCRTTSFLGRGLWIYAPIGFSMQSVMCDANGVGFDLDGVTSIGEGTITSCKFSNNTTSQMDLNAGTSFVHVEGTTFYGAATQSGVRFLANGIFSVGFYQCNFESATPAMSAGAGITVSNLTIENCVFNPVITVGTGYGLNFADSLVDARIQHNTFDCGPSMGATIVAIRVAGASSERNQIGPNTFVNNGAGTLTNYSLPSSTAIAYGITAAGASYGAVKNDSAGTIVQIKGPAFTLADTGVQNLTNEPEGFGVITSGQDDAAALYYFRGATGAVAEVSDPTGIFTTSSGSASSINVYWDAGDSRYEIQNLRGGDRSITVTLLGGSY